MKRRNALKTLTGSALTLSIPETLATPMASETSAMPALKGNLRHSVSRWCYSSIPLEEFCEGCKAIGIESIELTGPKEWEVLKKYGLTSAMGQPDAWPQGMGLPNCWNKPKNHDTLVNLYTELIPKAASMGIKNLITFSGNREGLGEYEGLLNCMTGLKKIMPIAEKNDVTITMELLSSRNSHPDYQCDLPQWGAVLCEMVGSPKLKMLYDIFHMQTMQGDHIRNVQRYGQYFSHYHTGGMPGRHEIDETQEIYYPAIMKAIVASGYKGFIGQEYVPTAKDKAGMMESLKKGVLICDV